MKVKNKLISVIASVSGLIIVDKIVGFIKQVVVASTFGATIETDIISLSQNAVSDIHYILTQVLITAFVTIYINARQLGDDGLDDRSRIFAGDAINAFIWISFVLTLVLLFLSKPIAKFLAPSYSPDFSRELSTYIKIHSLLIILFSLLCIYKAILSANKRFIPEQLVNFFQSTIIIVFCFVFSTSWGVNTLVVSFFVATAFNTLYLGFLCRRDVDYRLRNPVRNSDVKKLFKMIGPLLLGYSLIYVNQMVDRMLVSGLGAGVITSLSYGAVLSNLITTFITTFCSIIFTYVAISISKKEYTEASNIIRDSVKTLLAVFMPITITFYICSHEIVSIVFGHGAFDGNAVDAASHALKGYSIMFVPVILRETFCRFQYAFQDSKTPMVNGSIGIVSNIVLSILLCKYYGVFGVALATSLSVLISAVLNMITARNKTSELEYEYLKLFGLKFILSIIVSVSICLIVYNITKAWIPIIRVVIVFLGSIIPFALLFGRVVVQSLKTYRDMQSIKTEKQPEFELK